MTPRHNTAGTHRDWLSPPHILFLAYRWLLQNARIIRSSSKITEPLAVPPEGFPPEAVVTEDSVEWQIIVKALDRAYADLVDRWGHRVAKVIAHWYLNIEYLFVFDSSEGEGGGTCTGFTDLEFGDRPAVHLALCKEPGAPFGIAVIAATIVHEAIHLREVHHPPLFDRAELEAMLKWYNDRGELDPELSNALKRYDKEQEFFFEIPAWVIERATSGKDRDQVQAWREHFRDIVEWLENRAKRIFPEDPILSERLRTR